MLRSNFYDYSDGYILAKGTIPFENATGQGPTRNNGDKKINN